MENDNYLQTLKEEIVFLDDSSTIISDKITYTLYCELLHYLTFSDITPDFICEAGRFDRIKDFKITAGLARFFRDAKNVFTKIGKDFKMGFREVVDAFKSKDAFNLLKSFGFNLKVMLRSLNSITSLVRRGLLEIFKEIADTGLFKQLRKGAIKIDTILDKYPLLRKLIGPAIAGLLLYMWLNMTFIGDLDYDFNFADMTAALSGTFSVAQLFTSPEGIMLISLFASGAFYGISFPWLGKSAYNLVVGIVYTITTKAKDKKLADKFKRKMKFFRIKG